MPNCQAVMLIGFGGPTAGSEVRPFLDRVLAGRPVPRERYEEVVHHYQALGGCSPYNEVTMGQAAAVEANLHRMGIKVPVVAGFRHTPPSLEDALRNLKQRAIRRVFGFVLAAHQCEASWDRYLDDIESARQRLGPDAPEVEYPQAWHNDPGFIQAVAERTRAALERLEPSLRDSAELIFTAHSIPISMGGRAAYVEQLNESASLAARQLGRSTWTLAFQSRSGSPREPWLDPDVKDMVRRFDGGQVVLVPLGFLCDHVEVLYDLDVEAAELARKNGTVMMRAATVGDHPKFIEMIGRIAASHLSPA